MDEDVVTKVKAAIKIEDVIARDGFKVPDHGKYRKAAHSNGLVINTMTQTYHWNGTGQYGDVIQWVMDHKKIDFKEAVSELARFAGLPEPQWSKADQAHRLAARAREDALTIAAQVFASWMWRYPEVQEYVIKRGWTVDKVIEEGNNDTDDGKAGKGLPAKNTGQGSTHRGNAKIRVHESGTTENGYSDNETQSERDSTQGNRKQDHIDAIGNNLDAIADFMYSDCEPGTDAVGTSRFDGTVAVGTSRFEGTVARAMMGFSGRGTDAEREEMKTALRSGGVDLESPIAVAILGYKGNVTQWAQAHQIIDLNEDWLLNGWIPGMLGRSRLVYAHRESGRVVYLSSRAIADKIHYNLPEALVGKRRPYFNHEYAPGEKLVVVVEGQADAVSLGQWDIPAVALAGVKLDIDLVQLLGERHRTIYVALDMDVAGIIAAWKVADQFGPMCRVLSARDPMGVTFPTSEGMADAQKATVERANGLSHALARVYSYPILPRFSRFPATAGDDREVKDANDLLQAMVANQVSDADQRDYVGQILKAAPTFAELAAAWCGTRQGAERDQAVRDALSVIVRMGEMDVTTYRTKLGKLMGVGVRDLSNMIKTYNQKAAEATATGEPTFTWGEYVHGWLIEYMYELDSGYARLAWRDPDGKIDSGQSVTIEGKRYEPNPPTEGIRKGVVLMPAKIGDKKTLKELVTYIEMYLKTAFIWPSDSTVKLISNYVLLTWLYDCFDAVSYLAYMGDTGSGKSQAMFRTGLICYRAIIASGASSVSSLFRMVDRYKGSVVVDEADLEKSDTTQDMVKFYNTGAMRGGAITKSVDVVLPDGRHDYEERSFQTYCPKLMTLKRNFQDDAVTSRSMVIKLQPREMVELVRKNISLNIDDSIREKTRALRNLLLRFRLENWQTTIKVDQNSYDLSISARLNQIAGGLLAIARDDPEQQEMIRESLRGYYRESQITKSMTITARVIEAMWTMWKFPDMRQIYAVDEPDGRSCLKIGDVCKVTNEIINRMNSEEETDEDEKKWKQKGVKPHTVGRIIREDLQLTVSARKRDGFFVYWDEARMEGVALRFGLELDQIGPMETPLEKEARKKETPTNTKSTDKQGRLV